jgi:cytidyltransferase-like protein
MSAVSGPVIVYADVVCDLFHAGHIEFFRKARALGDALHVGLVSDADVQSYKPAPIMSLAERTTVVAACRYVDRIVPNPPLHCTRAFLDEIGAAFVCHGDDLSPADVAYWYADVIPSGRLRTVQYTAGVSSRGIIARIHARLLEGSLRVRL